MDNKPKRIILFDGVCNLCNNTVRFIHKNDKNGGFHFQSLQSEKGKDILSSMNYNGEEMKSFVFINGDQLFTKSTAALQVSKFLRFPYHVGQIFLIVPPRIRDIIYNFISKNRYKWFGKQKEVCEFDPSFQQKIV